MKNKKQVILILGGARSGKSSYAYRIAGNMFNKPLYLATGEALDKEMSERILKHKRERGRKWSCIEEPVDIARALCKPPPGHDGILLDCVTLWLSNVLTREGERKYERRRKEFLSAVRKRKRNLIIVGNEVGMGIVPDNELGRKFRDLAGRLNQDLAEEADAVVFVAAGLPVVLKGRVNC